MKRVHLDLSLLVALEEPHQVRAEVLAMHPREIVGLPRIGQRPGNPSEEVGDLQSWQAGGGSELHPGSLLQRPLWVDAARLPCGAVPSRHRAYCHALAEHHLKPIVPTLDAKLVLRRCHPGGAKLPTDDLENEERVVHAKGRRQRHEAAGAECIAKLGVGGDGA